MKDQTEVPFAHPECYARSLRDCSERISREHYVSAVVLRGVSVGEACVLVQNLSFQQTKDTPQKMGISSLVGKILCRKHNSALSGLDDAGKTLFDGMDRMDATSGKAGEKHETSVVNGDDLERWMLKILCGGLFSGIMTVPEGTMKGVCPPLDLLKILFQNAQFPDGQGLYFRAGTPGEAFSTDPAVLKLVVSYDKNVVTGLRMWVFNFEFHLVLVHLPPTLPPMLEHAHYRPIGLVVDGSANDIRFTWRSGGGNEIRVGWVGKRE
jgi:hypothetical protein